jgi:hypothetical protein
MKILVFAALDTFMPGMKHRSLFGVRVGDAFPHVEYRERIQV